MRRTHLNFALLPCLWRTQPVSRAGSSWMQVSSACSPGCALAATPAGQVSHLGHLASASLLLSLSRASWESWAWMWTHHRMEVLLRF